MMNERQRQQQQQQDMINKAITDYVMSRIKDIEDKDKVGINLVNDDEYLEAVVSRIFYSIQEKMKK